MAGEQGHRPRAYRRAARGVAACPEPLEALASQGRLREIAGIGPSLEALITEFLHTGSMRTHARLTAEHPPGLAPVLQARGFGPAGIQSLHAALGVRDLDDIERAAHEGRLAEALGPRRAQELVAQLPALRNPIRVLRLKPAWERAEQVAAMLRDSRQVRQLVIAGQVRRGCEMVTAGIDLIAVADASLLDLVIALPGVQRVVARDGSHARVRLLDGLELRVFLASAATLGSALVLHTGADGHLARLRTLAAARGVDLDSLAAPTEDAVYGMLGLPWIAPELREDSGEIEAAVRDDLPVLVELADLRGDMHCHTDWTDGSASLEDMARAARDRGYAYMALTDHSRSLTITNGLSLERLEQTRRRVERVNRDLAPFVVLLGTEMDILEDGSLDYPDEVLATLDYVSASVHSRFRQAEPAMTSRILRAVEHRLVHTLNHPHGRLLGTRPAYAVDMARVVSAASAAGTAMEVSGDPARMDLDGGWARQVKAAGGLCTISSDAHSTLDFLNIWLGVASARRGWLTRDDVLNTRPLDELKRLLARRTP